MKHALFNFIALIVIVMALPAQAQMDHRQMRQQRFGSESPQSQRIERPQGDESQRPGRMTPEERRQLRRDINEAGRDLYRRDSQRRPSP